MRNFFLLLSALLFLSSQAIAGNGYCDSRQSNREIENCYKNGIEVSASQIKKNYQLLMQSPKLSQQQKNELQKDQNAWIEKVGSYCGNDIRCASDSAVRRNSYLYLRLHKL